MVHEEVENSRKMGDILLAGLEKIRQKHPSIIGAVQGKGLVAAVCIVKSGSLDPDYDMAFKIVELCIEKGLMMFAPVGKATVKIAPPLCITEEEITEGLEVLAEAIDQATA